MIDKNIHYKDLNICISHTHEKDWKYYFHCDFGSHPHLKTVQRFPFYSSSNYA